jgi:phosphatidate phosphatase PAH1
MFGSYLTQGVYAVAGPFQPFGGAVDIIVVEQKDGSFKSSPWYVKFGDFQGAFTSRQKVVHISVNDAPAGFHMSLDINGDAYFEKEIETKDTEEGSVRPCSSSSSSDIISLEESVRSEDVLIGQSSSSQAFNGLEPSLSHDGRLRVEIEDVQKEASFGADDDSADVGAENPFLNGHVEYSNGSEYGLSYDSRIISETQETDVRSNVVDICFSGDSASIMEPQGANNAAESVMEITEPHQDAELKINLLCNTSYENSINNLAEKSPESLSEFRTEATNVVGGDSREVVNGSMIQNGEHDTVLVELGTQILELEFTLQSAQAETDITSSYSFEQLRHDEGETSSVENPQLKECTSSQKLTNGFGTETERSQGNAKDSNLLSPQKVEEAVVEINESEKPGEKEERKEKDEKIVVSRMPSSSKWNFWSLSFRGSRTEKGTSDHTLLTTSSLRTPAEGLLKENSYYKWSKKAKIRTYVPTSAQLASLKLIDGRNKVTFVFTSVLGKTEVRNVSCGA